MHFPINHYGTLVANKLLALKVILITLTPTLTLIQLLLLPDNTSVKTTYKTIIANFVKLLGRQLYLGNCSLKNEVVNGNRTAVGCGQRNVKCYWICRVTIQCKLHADVVLIKHGE